MCMPSMGAWSTEDYFVVFIMWAVMMVAMMVPSVAPMVLMFASVNRNRQSKEEPFVPTWIFLSGYLIIWTVFSFVVTILQGYLHHLSLISPMMVSTSPILSGTILTIAGIFQFTPFKNSCLDFCRSPLNFLMTHWKEGGLGALRMGLEHGGFCLGCCWALMVVLFATGVMNFLWIALISIFVLLENVVKSQMNLSRIAGAGLILWGIFMIFMPVTRSFAGENIYNFTMRTIEGEEKSLADYKGKALLVVNTASFCGYTPQYKSMEALYQKYKDQGLEILAFPANNFKQQEPGSDKEIKDFCLRKFQTTFPLFSKISVKGEDIHPLYQYLTSQPDFSGPITWNFNKFLISPKGEIVARYDSKVDPLAPEIVAEIEKVLPQK